MTKIRVGTRDSKLAVIQSQMVIEAIKKYDPHMETELIMMKTTGDRILDKTLDKIGGKGLFVKELDEALLNGDVDITVHSYKDMPMDLNADLPVVAVSKREDPRDVLIFPDAPDETKPLGCSSKRRTVQLTELGYEHILPLRGNVITRLKKMDHGEYRGIVLAAAGLKRLGLTQRISQYFSVAEMIPSAGQGTLAVQGRKGEDTAYLSLFHDPMTKIISDAERAFVRALEGGCSSPVAAYAYVENNTLILNGLYVQEDKNLVLKEQISGSLQAAGELGIKLAQRLKKRGELS